MEYPYCRKKNPANVGGGANDASNERGLDGVRPRREKKVKSHYHSLVKLSAHGSSEVTPARSDMSSSHIYLCKHVPRVTPRRLRVRTAHLTRESDASCV